MRAAWIVLSIVSWSGLALAEPAPAPRLQPVDYRFDDELVLGIDEDPLFDWSSVRRGGRRASLIEVKSSLVTELLKSAEDL